MYKKNKFELGIHQKMATSKPSIKTVKVVISNWSDM